MDPRHVQKYHLKTQKFHLNKGEVAPLCSALPKGAEVTEKAEDKFGKTEESRNNWWCHNEPLKPKLLRYSHSPKALWHIRHRQTQSTGLLKVPSLTQKLPRL